jgi:DNA helicase-2/ATP-dependent DNA helicase PcrA
LENYDKELSQELSHFRDILAVIDAQLRDAKTARARNEAELRESNRDMWQNAAHSADNFDAAVELSQYYQPLANSISAIKSAAERIRLLQRLSRSPYFARIDFRAEGKSLHEALYIGRGSLNDERGGKFHIYDWRSPIASLFYRFETGDACYDAPGGSVAGNIGLKRQYEIKNGVFEYFFDADVQIVDEYLRKMLSGNTSGKMKSIVETIQKDQDIAIRDTVHDLLMVQGIAGSGKTSVALHRVAYLKYRGLSGRHKSSDIIILSPNTLFGQYIGNVLPELGEEEVKSVVFDELVSRCLPEKILFQTRYEQTEAIVSCADPAEKALRKQALEFKTSGAFAEILKRYAQSIIARHIDFPDISYDGRTVFTGAALKAYIAKMTDGMSPQVKLGHLRRHIFEEIHSLRGERMRTLLKKAREDPRHPFDWQEYARALSIEEHTRLAKQIDAFIKLDCADLYRTLINTDGLIQSLSEGVRLPDNIGEILIYSKGLLAGPILQNEDALSCAFLSLLIGENAHYKQVRQVVIDEAQDYYDLHFEILRMIFPSARYTVLGDVNQTIEKQEDIGLYERISKILQSKSAVLMTLNKSFRCTREILSFSMRLLDDPASFESFNRSGDPPQLISAADRTALEEKLLDEIALSKSKGFKSVGVICKDAWQAEELYARLKDKTALSLARPDRELNLSGALVIPITMSKGLEFDSVLVYDVSAGQYGTRDDKKLLYIAATRALHRLCLFYTGEISPLIGKGGQA